MARPKKIKEPVVEEIVDNTIVRKLIIELIDEEFSSGIFQWKSLKLDKTFTQKVLSDLGKEGWKFAFVLDTSVWKKDGISEVYLQKFIKKGKK